MSKKGFTLIELLAVIVILAVIALIVTPVISGIINATKKSASARSVDGYIAAVNISTSKSLLDSNNMNNGRYYIDNNGNLIKSGKTYKVEINGKKPDSGELTIYNGKVLDGVVTIGNNVITYTNGKAEAKDVNPNKIYGLDYNINTKTYTRLESAAGLNACVGTDKDTCVNDFDSEEIYRDMVEVTDSYGNTFIKIPKFYIKKEVSDTNLKWYISRVKPDDSYYLPSCFYDFENNKELDYVLIGKYNANISNDNKLESKTNTQPLLKTNITQMRYFARANNSESVKGYQQLDIHVIDVLQTLFYVEEGTQDSQSIMMGFSAGVSIWSENNHPIINVTNTNTITLDDTSIALFRVGQNISISTVRAAKDVVSSRKIINIDKTNNTLTFDGNPVNITTSMIVSNEVSNSGSSDNILTSSGSAGDNNSGKYSMNYRGIENLYGNMWQYVDGITISDISGGDGTIYVSRDASKYINNDISSYNAVTGYKKNSGEGWITKMGYDSNYPFIQLPINTEKESNNSPYCDYLWNSSETKMRILLFGSNWYDYFIDGISAYDFNYDSTYIETYAGGRLIKKGV